MSHDADEASFSSDSWDGDDAVSSYPDPGDEETSIQAFRANFVFAPPTDADAAETKSAYKGPVRVSHEGAINTNALEAVIAAINGARGGFSGIAQETLESGYNTVVDLAVAAGLYDDSDAAPAFEAAAGDGSTDGDDGDGGGDGDDTATTGTVEAGFAGQIDATDGGDAATDGFDGVIWAAGTHTLHYNGHPTTVHVPEETIEPTFERLQERVAAGEATIGFDHPDDGSVAAKTPVGELGEMTDVSRSADGRQIVLTESAVTNNKAEEALAAGAFDGYDYSVVGDIHLKADADGTPRQTDDGALEVAAVDIHRVDVVSDGAVASAGVGAMPQVAAQAARLAAATPGRPATTFTATLAAAAADLRTTTDMTDDNDGVDLDDNPDTLEAAQAVLDDAKGVIEAKDDRIGELEAKLEAREAEADAFGEIAAAHGLDPGDEDVAPQDVIDEHTEHLREDVAELEAEWPKSDTGSDDGPSVEERSEDLRGKGAATLESMRDKLAWKKEKARRERQERSGAVAAGAAGAAGSGFGGGGGDEEVEQLADNCLTPAEKLEAESAEQDAAEYIRQHYDVDPADHANEQTLNAAMSAAAAGGDGQ